MKRPKHFVLHCPGLAVLRVGMELRIDKRLRETDQHAPLADWFRSADDFSRFCFLLGGQMKTLGRDHPLRKLFVDSDVVAAVDVIVRNFLMLAWRARASLLSNRPGPIANREKKGPECELTPTDKPIVLHSVPHALSIE